MAGPPGAQVFRPAPRRRHNRLGRRVPAAADQRGIVARPNASENVVLILAAVPQPTAALLPLTRRVNECGCSVVEARVSCLGQEVVVALLASGPWDAIAKLESAVARLEREDDIKAWIRRTTVREPQANLMPYVVEVVAADRPGALFQLTEFFASRGIAVEQLTSSRYRAMQTGADMFSAQITIGIPAKTHIAALRDDFLEFCDAQNLDAIMDPMKY